MKAAGRAVYGLALVLCLSACVQALFYQPDRVVYDTPKRAGLPFEEVRFQSRDGTRLAGWFIPASGKAKGTVVHFHGNAQNLSAHWRFVEWLPQRGFNLFVFDYRGYGASEGTPDPRGVFEDSSSALDYVRSRRDVDPDRLLLIGQSLGGANAIAVVGSGNRKGVKALIVEASFYSYSSIASDKLAGAGVLLDDSYSPERYIDRLARVPLLLIHGTADPVVPYAHATRLYAKASEPKRLIAIQEGGHIEAFAPRHGRKYMDVVTQFLDAALSGK